MMLPELQPEELMAIKELSKDLSEVQQKQFILLYRGKRKEQQHMLIFTLIGFFGFAGIQRFVIGDIGLGILYLLTFGFCGIGTIIDLVNIRRMTTDFNLRQAYESASMARVM